MQEQHFTFTNPFTLPLAQLGLEYETITSREDVAHLEDIMEAPPLHFHGFKIKRGAAGRLLEVYGFQGPAMLTTLASRIL